MKPRGQLGHVKWVVAESEKLLDVFEIVNNIYYVETHNGIVHMLYIINTFSQFCVCVFV